MKKTSKKKGKKCEGCVVAEVKSLIADAILKSVDACKGRGMDAHRSMRMICDMLVHAASASIDAMVEAGHEVREVHES